MRIIQADYIFSLNQKPIKNGFLYIEDDGSVIHISDIPRITNDFKVEKYSGIICPGFVNTHCHLELSHMKNLIREGGGLESFIVDIQKKRAFDLHKISDVIEKADKEMQNNGIVAVGDVCNTLNTLQLKKNSKIWYHSFVEIFGLENIKSEAILKDGRKNLLEYHNNNLSASLVPHAFYSVSIELFKKIYANNKGDLRSMHHQESASENQFFFNSKKGVAKFFKSRGLNISKEKRVGRISTQHEKIGYISEQDRVLLVHNTYSKQKDIDFIKNNLNQVYWCTCPKANWYIERQLPNYNLWKQNNLKITLGTDSLASNNSLSILEEMILIQKKFPHISTNELLIWGCKNGAEFLGLGEFGSLTPGKKPGVLLIKNTNEMNLTKSCYVQVLI